MTKEQYFEMCEQLGTEPIDEEIPIEFEDLNDDVQEAFVVYNMLQDMWDTMNGGYLGKNFAGIKNIFEMMDIESPKSCFNLLSIIDAERSKQLNNKIKEAKPKKKPTK